MTLTGLDAHAVARTVAARLVDPVVLAEAVARTARQSDFAEANRWRPVSLASGATGLALMCTVLAERCPDEGWDLAGHRMLGAAAAELPAGGGPIGLYEGLSGLAAVASLAGAAGRYRTLRTALDRLLLPALRATAATPPPADPPPAWYDLIGGLTGQAAYLSLRERADTGSGPALRAVLTALLDLLPDAGPPLPVPAAAVPDWQRVIAPHGYVDCGLAHGVAGPLALLAVLAGRPGLGSGLGDRTLAALDRLAGWLAAATVEGPQWPRVALLDETGTGTTAGPPNRPGWCYGTPGVARAMWLAGRALGSAPYRGLGVDAMKAALRRADELASPTLCHGLAGLLLITLRFAADTGDPAFVDAAGELTGRLLAAYDPGSLLGYLDVEVRGAGVDNPGLLCGASGVVLALLATESPIPLLDRLMLVA
jgi:hypothetical protein